MRDDLLRLFPESRHAFWRAVICDAAHIQEIRMRIGQPVIVRRGDGERYLDETGRYTVQKERAHRTPEGELEAFLCHICHDSPYAFEDELRQGFITVPGGHRVGIVGQAVPEENGGIRTMKHVYYMNIRIAHQVIGAADPVLPLVYERGQLRNTLILSPPGGGKTTLLRELVRQISEGNAYGRGLQVGVVDERSELAGSYLGVPQNDLGCRTDVLDGCPKALGMMILLRSMAPQVIAVDELGGAEDVASLCAAAACGSRILATVHGEGPRDVAVKFPELFERKLFERMVILGREGGEPVVKRVYRGEEIAVAHAGRDHDTGRLPRSWVVVPGTTDRQDARAAQSDGDSGAVYE